MKKITKKTSTRPTPAQMKARIKNHKPHWTCLVRDDLNKSYFQSLARGRDKFTPGKQLAGLLDRLCAADPEFMKSPIETETDNEGYVHHKLVGKGCTCVMAQVGRALMRAVLKPDKQNKKFLDDFRTAWSGYQKERKNPKVLLWRKIRQWMELHPLDLEACRTKYEAVRLLQSQFPKLNERYCYTLLGRYGLGCSHPPKSG